MKRALILISGVVALSALGAGGLAASVAAAVKPNPRIYPKASLATSPTGGNRGMAQTARGRAGRTATNR